MPLGVDFDSFVFVSARSKKNVESEKRSSKKLRPAPSSNSQLGRITEVAVMNF